MATLTGGSSLNHISDLLLTVTSSRFKPAIVKECIREIVRERLSGVRYDPEEVSELSHTLADCIKDKVKSELCTSTVH